MLSLMPKLLPYQAWHRQCTGNAGAIRFVVILNNLIQGGCYNEALEKTEELTFKYWVNQVEINRSFYNSYREINIKSKMLIAATHSLSNVQKVWGKKNLRREAIISFFYNFLSWTWSMLKLHIKKKESVKFQEKPEEKIVNKIPLGWLARKCTSTPCKTSCSKK